MVERSLSLQIGEPRLDTGLVPQEYIRPPFDPITPLLPEEVCWILDRAMAFEVNLYLSLVRSNKSDFYKLTQTEFHSGNFLAHTVHTLLYIHHLDEVDPECVMKWLSVFKYDRLRPLPLVTIVLRSAVQALLKCVELSWRELAGGGMYDVRLSSS
jgi:hypothetical protein